MLHVMVALVIIKILTNTNIGCCLVGFWRWCWLYGNEGDDDFKVGDKFLQTNFTIAFFEKVIWLCWSSQVDLFQDFCRHVLKPCLKHVWNPWKDCLAATKLWCSPLSVRISLKSLIFFEKLDFLLSRRNILTLFVYRIQYILLKCSFSVHFSE